LSFWPYKYINAKDTEKVLSLFTDIVESRHNLAIMAHINHYKELETEALEIAVENILETGAQIMSQSPLLRNINDSAEIWAKMWKKQVDLNITPYYMFIVRNTGAQQYFRVPLVRAWRVFKEAYSQVSGICRTVRGPSMSCTPGKLNVLGEAQIKGEKVMVLSFLQGRNPQWVNRPFFAKYNPEATWISDLEPAVGDKFFYEEDLLKYLGPYNEIKKYIMREN
jgi:L-lysine 2,3-aminomutase